MMRIGFAICAGKWQLLPSRPDPTTSPIHDDDDDDGDDDNDDGDDFIHFTQASSTALDGAFSKNNVLSDSLWNLKLKQMEKSLSLTDGKTHFSNTYRIKNERLKIVLS